MIIHIRKNHEWRLTNPQWLAYAVGTRGGEEGATKVESSFGALLRGYRERAGLAQNGLARASGVNVGTVNRLERGQRLPAGREQALALARTLGLNPSETNRLLAAAGLPAEGFGPEITSHPTIRALVDLLQDDTSPRADRDGLLTTLEGYVHLVARANGRAVGGHDAT